MRITQEADYALRTAALLAQSPLPVGAPRIATTVSIPPRFAMKILRKLSLGGIVRATRGVTGGYSLALKAEEIRLRQVIEAIDGPIAIRHCLCGDYICDNSPNKGDCRFHRVFAALNGMITERLDRLTVADMINSALPVEELINIIK